MYKLLLILRYLRKRRIAWASLVAVTLCTALVLVVISVMGGWLRMFRQSFHGLSGDILVKSTSLGGYPYYEEMTRRIEALPFVGAGNAVPVIRTVGLISFQNDGPEPVQIFGYPLDKIGRVNDFPDSLYRQHQLRQEAAIKAKDTHRSAAERAYFASVAGDKTPPSFALAREISLPFKGMPPGVSIPESLASKVVYLPVEGALAARGEISDEELNQLLLLSNDLDYQWAIRDLYEMSDFRRVLSKVKKVDVRNYPGIILGSGVARIHKDVDGKIIGRSPTIYRVPVKLMVIGISPDGGTLDLQNKAEPTFWIVDDSRTGVYQYDSQAVYVSFDTLQKYLGMEAVAKSEDTDGMPARTSEIDVRITPGYDLNTAKEKIDDVCRGVMMDQEKEHGQFRGFFGFHTETWEDSNRVYLHAIENEKVLVLFLFGMISIVAVFLVFCIFYMIVVEKTRDIGIIKSVGATNSGVAGIFLGYGFAIGIVGSGIGLLLAWLIVHNINEIHTWLGHYHNWLGFKFSIVVWDPQVYAFDTIPNRMDPKETTIIVVVGIIAAVAGAFVPARRAAKLHPVEALRWE